MSAYWNERFSSWAQPPSATEAQKIQNSINAVQAALRADNTLSQRTKVFVQGSYRNRVNVRQESDVDIGVLYTGNLFGPVYPPGMSGSDFNVIDVSYGYSHFKNDLESALVSHFGRSAVLRGDKAFDVHENTYRVDADVVPLMEHRRFYDNGTYICGTELRPDSGGRIFNWPEKLYSTPEWPEQHYENGNAKNNQTRRAYRAVVRVVKKLRHIMNEGNVAEADPIKGFLIECMVWNVPNEHFAHETWFEDVRSVLNYLSSNTYSMSACEDWTEVSGYKWLFRGDDAKRAEAESFVDAARRYIGVA
ncbi:nucleotidyltransferase domain-containing protein [Luteimonas sp. A482]